MAATKPAKGNRKFGAQRTNKTKQVVSLRDKKLQSWASIGETIGVSPRTARRLYDEAKGEGAHHGLLPGKGGQHPVSAKPAKATPKAKKGTKATK